MEEGWTLPVVLVLMNKFKINNIYPVLLLSISKAHYRDISLKTPRVNQIKFGLKAVTYL